MATVQPCSNIQSLKSVTSLALRERISAEGLDGFLVPRADAHQGEYVADCDARLAWLTGFTGSAGFCAALRDVAGVFVDGRYRVQVRSQVDLDAFTPVDWPEVKLGEWLKSALPDGGKVGFDPWLHTKGEIGTAEMALRDSGIQLVAGENLVDRIWQDRPAPPDAKIVDYPIEFAGKSSPDKRTEIAGLLREAKHSAAILTQPESIAWLLNIRGADLPRVPVALAFAILFADGKVSLFTDPDKVSDLPADPDIDVHDWSEFPASLARLEDNVRVDKTTAPLAVSTLLNEADVRIVYASDPCMLPNLFAN